MAESSSGAGEVGSGPGVNLPCKEFSEFKDALHQARAIDDHIVYRLNSSVPTESFAGRINSQEQCKSLYGQLSALHGSRLAAIQQCVDHTRAKVQELNALRDSGTAEAGTLKKELRKEQTKLRLMQNELVVEEVVRERTLKVFRERCWKSFRPP